MALALGQAAPTFRTHSDDGTLVDLAALKGNWVALYFYPRANTSGCSLEAQRFEQALPEFEQRHAKVIGVSTDTEAKQAAFREKCQLSFPLLPDGNKEISRAYGVIGGVMGLLGIAARQTFLIDPAGSLAYQWTTVNPARHAAEVLAKLVELQQKTA